MIAYRQMAVLVGFALCVLSTANAQILNSERIEQTFGSYGIELVHSDSEIRVSNLYSLHEGERVTRTLAIVRYPDRVPAELEVEHASIVAGGSIGATFKSAGWSVNKVLHTLITDVELPPTARQLMEIEGDADIAVHAYALNVANELQQFSYATIIELHHPGYLAVDDLRAIYGPWGEVTQDLRASLEAQLAAGFTRLAAALEQQ